MINKRTRNTLAAKWAQSYNCSVHKAIIYRHKLKKHIKFGYFETDPQDTFLTCLAVPHYYFAVYQMNNGKWELYGINDHWAFENPEEVADFGNKNLIPFYCLTDEVAKEFGVPNDAVQLLMMNKKRVK